MASAVCEPVTGIQGQSPWSGGQGAKPLKLKTLCKLGVQMGRKFANFYYLVNC